MPFVGPTATGANKTGLICRRKLPEQSFSKEDSKLLEKRETFPWKRESHTCKLQVFPYDETWSWGQDILTQRFSQFSLPEIGDMFEAYTKLSLCRDHHFTTT